MKLIVRSGYIIVVALSLLFAGCSAKPSQEEYFKRAQIFLDKGEFASATIELKNLLQENPDHAGARALLGQAYLASGDYANAQKELQEALQRDGDPDVVVPLLAKSLLSQGNTEDVHNLSSEELQPASRAVVLAAQGSAQLASGDMFEAQRLVDQALKLDPASAYAQTENARIQIAAGETADTVRQALQAILSENAAFSPALVLLGDLERGQGNPDLALDYYNRALAAGAPLGEVLLKRVVVNVEANRTEMAEMDMATLRQAGMSSANVMYLQGIIHFQRGQYQQAVTDFETPLRYEKAFPLAFFYAGSSHLELGNIAQASAAAQRFHRFLPQNREGKVLLVRVALAQQNYPEAEKFLRQLRAGGDSTHYTDALFAAVLLQEGRADEALSLLQQLASGDNNSADVQFQLGQSYFALRDQESAVVHFRSALQLNPGYSQAYSALALLYLQQGAFDKAEQVAQDYLGNRPDSAAPLTLLGRVQLAAGKGQEARKSFLAALEKAPADPVATGFLMDMSMAEGNAMAARDYAQETLRKSPDQLETLVRLARIDLQENSEVAFTMHLEQAATAHPDALEPKLMLARYHLARGRPDKVPAVLGQFFQEPGGNPGVLEAIGMSQLLRQDYPAARMTLEKLANLRPTEPSVRYMLSRAYGGMNDLPQLERELDATIQLNPEHFAANLELARLYFSRNQGEELAQSLATLKELNSQHPGVLLLEAEWENRRGNREQSLALYKELFAVAPITEHMLTLSRNLSAQGNGDEAVATMESWVVDHPEDIVARHALAAVYAYRNRQDAANDQYRQILTLDADNPIALNNLAWNLREIDPKQAMTLAQKAVAANSNHPGILDTYAVMLLADRQTDRAYSMIQRALAEEPGEPEFLYHQAQILQKLGRLDEAKSSLVAALANETAFAARTRAEELLAEIKGNLK